MYIYLSTTMGVQKDAVAGLVLFLSFVLLVKIFFAAKKFFRRRHKNPENENKEENMTESERETAISILEEMKRRTQKKCIQLTTDIEREGGIFDSKLGGFPYWDSSMEYPLDSEGNKLFLLAQINLEQLPKLPDSEECTLPEKGILQFFIAKDDSYGLDFDDMTSQKNSRVIYHKEIDRSVTEEQVKEMGIPEIDTEDYEFPLEKKCALDAKISESIDESNHNPLFIEVAKSKLGIDEAAADALHDSAFAEKDIRQKYDNGMRHLMLGHPNFTQDDPREFDEDLRRYDTQLLQLETNYNVITWGDGGVANFFINAEDLKKGDFSKILYTWDCC